MKTIVKTELNGVSVSRSIALARELAKEHAQDFLPYKNFSLQQFFDVVKNLPYDAKEFLTGEVLKSPNVTLREGGDCDDKAILMAGFLLAYPQKIETAFDVYFLTADWGKGEAHIFVGVLPQSRNWFYIDATYAKNKIGKVYSNPKKLRAYKI